MATLTKKNISLKWQLTGFRDSVHYHHGKEHAGMQAGMVLENESPCRQQGSQLSHWVVS